MKGIKKNIEGAIGDAFRALPREMLELIASEGTCDDCGGDLDSEGDCAVWCWYEEDATKVGESLHSANRSVAEHCP